MAHTLDPMNSSPQAHRDSRPRQTRSHVCTECRRQKQKCDRQTPCSNCVRRRIAHSCSFPGAARTVNPPAYAPVAASPTPSIQVTTSISPADVSVTASSTESTRVGRLFNFRGAPSYHGTSYFGHQAAADMIHADHALPGTDIGRRGRDVLRHTRRSERGPYSHIWDLVSHLPRRKEHVDNLLERFLQELNPAYDSLHEETFRTAYDAFWNRKWADDDLTAIDLRWLSLLFMVLAFGELLVCPLGCSSDMKAEYEEASVEYFWAARKTLVIAPTFSGESPDIVRAGLLVSRYLVYLGRKNESWLTCSFAVRMAQSQGMHIDGQSWGLPPKVLEARRRVWCALYTFDRGISLSIGRPYSINDSHCMEMKVRNLWVDDMSQDEAIHVEERPLSDPTPSVFYIYQQRLAILLGHIHDECFGLGALKSSYTVYEKVLKLDAQLLEWAASLPSYFRLQDPDLSMTSQRPFLTWQRLYLHSAYHFAHITLHRPFVFLDSITDQFKYSRDRCIESACADLKLKLSFRDQTMGDRLRAAAAMHNYFNSALVLGIIAVRDPSSQQTAAILQDLSAYCEKQNGDPWPNEFAQAEIRVIELCIDRARRARDGAPVERHPGPQQADAVSGTSSMRPPPGTTVPGVGNGYTDSSDGPGRMEIGANWMDGWLGPNWHFPEPLDFHLWEDLVDTFEARE